MSIEFLFVCQCLEMGLNDQRYNSRRRVRKVLRNVHLDHLIFYDPRQNPVVVEDAQD